MEKLFEINVSGTSYYFGDLTTSSALSAHVSDTSIHQTSGEVEDMLTAYTYDKATIDEKVASGGSSGMTSGEVQTLIDESISGKLDVNVFNVYSGVVASEVQNKAENSDLEALESTFSAFSATIINEIQEIESSGMTSGAVQDMLTAYTYSKQEIDDKDAQKLDITAFSAYSGEVSSQLSGKASTLDYEVISGIVSAMSIEIQEIESSGITSGEVQTLIDESISGKQDVLVSGVNIKTINGNSVLGSGNIEIQGGSGSGVSSGEVQTMIDQAVSGKANNSDLTSHTSNNVIHVTASDKTAWNAKVDANAFTAHTADTTVHITAAERTSWNNKPNVWIGDSASWSAISGSTENGVIYLVY